MYALKFVLHVIWACMMPGCLSLSERTGSEESSPWGGLGRQRGLGAVGEGRGSDKMRLSRANGSQRTARTATRSTVLRTNLMVTASSSAPGNNGD
jgi:hypothetical protein